MTTEEKAKAYDEAVERAKDCLTDKKFCETEDTIRSIAEYIFPELAESEDERVIRALETFLNQQEIADKITFEARIGWLTWLEKQKEIPMPNSTELIEMWDNEKKMLKEKDFRGDEWRLAYNAFMDGFARGTCVKFEKQKEQKPKDTTLSREDCLHQLFENGTITMADYLYLTTNRRKQKPAEKQDYSGLNDLERAIHRGFLSAGVENIPVTVIKETAKECLAQMKPAEWSDDDTEMYINVASSLRGYACGLENEEHKRHIQKELDWLENRFQSLRPSWKPSQEQMEAFDDAMTYIPEFYKPKSTLASLLRDLKKLM